MENHSAKPVNKTADHKKRAVLIVLACVLVLGLVALGLWNFWLKDYLAAGKAEPVYVNSVASITGMGNTETRFSGLVEPQQVMKVNKDESRTVAEVLVAEGDQVSVGTPLFRYDTEEMVLTIRQAELELEGIANQISTLQDQKKTLEAEKAKASSDEQYNYTVQIQSTEFSIKEAEYNRSVKQAELEKLKNSQENADVLSEAEGVIQEINLTPSTDSSGQQKPFMSILSSGEYRVKGSISEQNYGMLQVGQQVVVRSRVDPSATWSGAIDSIGGEPTEDQNQNTFYYGSNDQGQQASKYNFYVVLDNLDGLLLGQHVYIEPNLGVSSSRTGMWLPAIYVVSSDRGSYVWARDENEKLEKRPVMLGEFDQGEDLYQIVDGLEPGDYIAYPSEDHIEGGPTTTDASAMTIPGEDDMTMGEDPGLDLADPGLTDVMPEAGSEEVLDGDGTLGNTSSVLEDGEDAGLYESGLGDASTPDGGEGLAR